MFTFLPLGFAMILEYYNSWTLWPVIYGSKCAFMHLTDVFVCSAEKRNIVTVGCV